MNILKLALFFFVQLNLSAVCFSQIIYPEKQYEPVFHENNSVNAGMFIGIGLDDVNFRSGFRINYYMANLQNPYNRGTSESILSSTLRNNLIIGGGLDFLFGGDSVRYELELVGKYLIIIENVIGIYPVVGGKYRFWIDENSNRKELSVLFGLGVTRNIKMLTLFADITFLDSEVQNGIIKSGVLFNFIKQR